MAPGLDGYRWVRQNVSLACLSEAQVGDPVLVVHIGLPLSFADDAP